jgi:hypothetical protein
MDTRNSSKLLEMASSPVILLFQVSIPFIGLISTKFNRATLTLRRSKEGSRRVMPSLFSSREEIKLNSSTKIQGRKGSKECKYLICDENFILLRKLLGAYMLENVILSPNSKLEATREKNYLLESHQEGINLHRSHKQASPLELPCVPTHWHIT